MEEFLTKSPKKLFNRVQLLGEIVGLKHVEHPLQLLDVMLGQYICRRDTLPCNSDGECFTVGDYVEIADETWDIAKRMFEKTSLAHRSMCIIEAWNLLKHLSNSTITARNTPRGRKIIKVSVAADYMIF